MADIALKLAPVPESIPKARHALERLVDAVEQPTLDNLRLLVSEVVTNSVRHGTSDGAIELRITINPYRVRVEVEDHGPGFNPTLADDPIERSSGWGLLLVDRLAARWGVVSSRTTTVWFELDRASRRA